MTALKSEGNHTSGHLSFLNGQPNTLLEVLLTAKSFLYHCLSGSPLIGLDYFTLPSGVVYCAASSVNQARVFAVQPTGHTKHSRRPRHDWRKRQESTVKELEPLARTTYSFQVRSDVILT